MARQIPADDIRFTLIKDRGILIRPITESMRLYKVSYETIRSARRILHDQLIRDKGFDVIKELRQARLEQRYIYRLANLEEKYPGMLRSIAQVRPQRGKSSRLTLKAIGSQYGLTKQRMSQIRQILLDAASTFGMDEDEIVEDVLSGIEDKKPKKKRKNRKKKRAG